jgi:hypothetical protein
MELAWKYIESVNNVFFFCDILPSESWNFIIIMHHLELTLKSYELIFELSCVLFCDTS